MLMGDPRYSFVLPEFPQPSRPPFSYDMNPEPLLREERLAAEYHHPEVLELPNLSRNMAISSYDSCFESHPPPQDELHNQSSDLNQPPQFYAQFSEPPPMKNHGGSSSEERIHFSPSTGKTPKGEKEVVDELLLILIECMDELNTRSRESLLRKFFSEIEREERLERFIIERLKQSRVKAISELCEKLPAKVPGQLNSDGFDVLPTISEVVDDDSISTRSIHESVEELSQKLERFKVKTLDLGVVVIKDEENK